MLYRRPSPFPCARSTAEPRLLRGAHGRAGLARVWIGMLLWAMVLMQTFGLVHRSAHFAHTSPGVSAFVSLSASATPTSASAQTGHPAATWLKTLFEGHSEGASCVLYDQLGHADALFGVPMLVLPAGINVLAEVVHPAWHLAHQAAGFLARGPPTPV